MHRDGESAQPGTESPAPRWISSPHTTAPAIFHLKDFHEPLRESAEIRRRLRDVYEACRDRRKFVVITSPVRFIPEEIERSVLFLELRPPDLVELVDFLRDETGHTPASGAAPIERREPAPAGARPAGAHARRSALRAAPRPGRRPQLWGPNRCPAARREAPAGEPQRRDRIHRRAAPAWAKSAGWKASRSGCRAPQAVPDARQPERRDRAQGAAHDGHSGLRQKPVR